MAEEVKNMAEEVKNEKKVVSAYVIKNYSNGDKEIEDAHLEGTTALTTDEMYHDIELTHKAIELRRMQDATYLGIVRFYEEMGRRAQAEAQAAAAAEAAKEAENK